VVASDFANNGLNSAGCPSTFMLIAMIASTERRLRSGSRPQPRRFTGSPEERQGIYSRSSSAWLDGGSSEDGVDVSIAQVGRVWAVGRRLERVVGRDPACGGRPCR